MICFRDKTWCSFSNCANFGPCHRSLTQDVIDAAEISRLPISQFAEIPDCYQGETGPEYASDKDQIPLFE